MANTEQHEKIKPDIGWPHDAFGTPLVRITCCASEKIPTVQYGNAEVGPISVTRFVPDGSDEQLAQHIRDTQKLCEAAVAEDRQTLHEQIRARAGQ